MKERVSQVYKYQIYLLGVSASLEQNNMCSHYNVELIKKDLTISGEPDILMQRKAERVKGEEGKGTYNPFTLFHFYPLFKVSQALCSACLR